MKRARIITYGFLVFLITSGYVLFKPEIMYRIGSQRINNYLLDETGWSLKIESLRGHLFDKIQAGNLVFSNADGRIIEIPDLLCDINLISLLFGQIRFNSVAIKDVYVKTSSTIGNDTETDSIRKVYPARFIIPVSISDFFMDGLIQLDSPTTFNQINIHVQGKLNSKKGKAWVNLDELKYRDLKNNVNFILEDAFFQISPTTIIASINNAELNDINVKGNLKYFEDKVQHLQGNLELVDFHIPTSMFEQIPLQPDISSLDIYFSFNTDFNLSHGTLQVKSPLGLDMSGKFLVQSEHDYYRIHQIALNSANSRFSGTGVVEKSGRINTSFELENFDISEWVVTNKKTSISGLLLLEGNMTNNQIHSLAVSTEIQDTKLYQGETLALSGSASYSTNMLRITDPLVIGIGVSTIETIGWANFDERTMEFDFDLVNANPYLINNFISDTLEHGEASGTLEIRGSMDEPTIEMDLGWNNIQYKNLYVSKGSLNSKIKNIEQLEEGYAHIQVDNGQLNDQIIDNAALDISFSPDKIDVEHLYVKQNENYLELIGNYNRSDNIDISRLQVAYKSHFIVNPSSIKINYEDSVFRFHPFELHVDDGVCEGTGTWGDTFEGNLRLSNVSSELVSEIIPQGIPEISGMIFGEVSTKVGQFSQDYTVDIAIKNGSLQGQSFQDLVLAFVYLDSVLHIDEMTMIGDKVGLQISGTFPQNKSGSKIAPVTLETSFTNMDMDWFMTFMPPWFYLGGNASGSFSLLRNAGKVGFDFDLDIKEAVFDKIPLGRVSGRGNYNGDRLNFESFTAKKPNSDSITGHGYLPLDLTAKSPTFGKFKPNDSLYIDVSGHFDNMDFLTLYLADVDSISGDIDLNLILSGPANHIIRNGKIDLKDGTVYTILLNDPIHNVSGNASIKDNLLTFNSLKGMLSEKKNGKKTNVTVTGGMDLTRFFKPNYNFHAKGNNLYLRVLEDDITGTVNADLNITGRDTITIVGDVGLINVEMYQDFESQNVGQVTESGGTVLEYKINFPIINQLTLLNTQMDAKLIGEISYTKLGQYEADYAGELQFEEGKFYFYGDIFEITYGYLSFDNQGFNPYMEIEAVTTIEDEVITLQIVGTIDNLKINPISSSGYSPSDILELLTMGKRYEDMDLSTTGIGDQTKQILGSWVATQIERNLANLSGGGNLGIIDDVSISVADPNSKEQLAIKAGITDNLSFAYRRSFSLANPLNEVGVELKVNRYISVVGSIDENNNFNVKYRLRYSY